MKEIGKISMAELIMPTSRLKKIMIDRHGSDASYFMINGWIKQNPGKTERDALFYYLTGEEDPVYKIMANKK